MYLRLFTIIFLLLTASMSVAREYIIYSIMQDIPMGYTDELVKKNYYINLGSQQGVREGTFINVFRNVSILDPYKSKNRYNYKVKIGELKVLHAEDQSAIANMHFLKTGKDDPYFEISSFMIGDKVDVKIVK